MPLKLWHVPLRLATGAFILNSGLSKRGTEGEAAEGLHDFAVDRPLANCSGSTSSSSG